MQDVRLLKTLMSGMVEGNRKPGTPSHKWINDILKWCRWLDGIQWHLQHDGFEMWIWRRMEKISWLDKVTNEEVLGRVNDDRQILNSIR